LPRGIRDVMAMKIIRMKKARKSAARYVDVKAKRLGQTLADFRTSTMIPVLGEYKGVVARK